MRAVSSLLISLAFFHPAAAMAQDAELPAPQIYGFFHFIATIHEDAKSALAQEPSGDQAAQEVSGFQERRARLGVRGKLAGGTAGYNVQTDWAANTPTVVDFWGSGYFSGGELEVRFGRFKPHLSAEMHASGAELPDIERSLAGKLIASYMFPQGTTRDLGLKAIYSLPGEMGTLHLSATNGLGNGPGAQAGGSVINQKNVRSKNLEDGMLCAGLDLRPGGGLTVSVSAAVNRIRNASTADGKVFDIDRSSYAAGARYDTSTLWLDGEYTAASRGAADSSGKDEMRGYYLRLGAWILPGKLDVMARQQYFEQGVENKVRDKAVSLAVRGRHGGLEAVLEYTRTGGEKGSVFGPSDPSSLAARLGFKF